MTTRPTAELRRDIGVFGAMMMGMGSIVGTGVFVSIGIAAEVAGPSVIVAIALASLVAICNGLSSAQLAAIHPVSGGTYEYGYQWLSPRLGFTAGWMFLCAKSASAATAALGFSGYLLHASGGDQQGWLLPVALVTLGGLTLIVLTGIKQSSTVNIAIVVVTLASLTFFVAAGLPTALSNANQYLSPNLNGITDGGYGLLQATALMFVAYTGYGRIATLGEEVKEPQRTIPRAVIATLIASMVLYVSVAFVGLGAVGAEAFGAATRQQVAPLEVVAARFGIPGATMILAVGAMTAMLGVLLNLLLGLSRVLLAMGRRGDMPGKVAAVSTTTSVPWIATLVVAAIIGGLVLLRDVKLTWSFSAFTVLIYYALTNLCALRLRPEQRLFPIWPAWFGLASCVFLAFWVDWFIWLAGLAMFALGLLWHGFAVTWKARGSAGSLRCVAALVLTSLSCSIVQGADAKASRPNILFAIADDASYPHMGAYGCTWVETPAFDRIARQGLLFTRAYTPNAKCAPSRASILTGRNSWQLEQAANHNCFFPAKFKVYPEVLAQHGYHVGMTGKGWAPGVAKDEAGRPRRLAGKPYQGSNMKPPTGGISGNDYAGNFAAFLGDAPRDAPWCFWYGGHEPHREYEFGSGIAKGGKKLSDVDKVPDFWPDNDAVRTDMLDYAYEVEYFDKHLARMLDVLDKRGELQNTLVVVTADNGMPFPRIKGQKYELSNHLPLAVMWPEGIKKPGRTIDDYVSFIDFAPTFIEAAGLQWSDTGMHSTPARSLTDIFNSEKSGVVDPARDHVLIGKERHDIGRPHDWGYPVRGIVQGELLYLHNFEPTRWPAGNPETGYLNTDGSPTKTVILEGRTDPATERFWRWSFGKRPAEELYDLAKDPLCLHNLAAEVKYEAARKKLNERAFRELKEQDDPRMFGRGDVFDRYPYADAGLRTFYERYLRGEKLRAGWVNPTDFEKEPIRP